MRDRRLRHHLLRSVLAVLLGVVWLSLPLGASNADPRDKIDPSLRGKDRADYWVMFHDRADLKAPARTRGWAARGDAVVKALKKTANSSQVGARGKLRAAGADFQPFFIANAILVRHGSLKLAERLAADDEVSAIVPTRNYELAEVTPAAVEPSTDAVEWGIAAINANDVWSTFGVRGEGIVVGSIDTGAQFNHPALVTQYRGNQGGGNFDHNYNWFDPSLVCGNPSLAPCDNNDHGTHTIGTMVGDDDDSNQIGVAPRARWISAKGCESNSCSDAGVLASGQWMLAPTDLTHANPRPDLRPHIVNISWGAPNGPIEDPFYSATVNAWVAAGIFPMFSNGNDGPNCDTSGSPGDYAASYSAGAFDINGAIASFSSRGPGENGDIKPNISAPGVSIRSSVPGGGYAAFDGTSMASPHTAGAVALIWSAVPSAIGDIGATRGYLDGTATDVSDLTCGGSADDNNVWGEGKLDALAAVTAAANDVNDPPTAADDGPYTTAEDTALTVPAPGVLANDTDPDGDTLEALLETAPMHGSVVLNANGSFTYTPNANFFGEDSMTYRASDGPLTSNLATVKFTVTPVNDAPIAGDELYAALEDTPLTEPAPGVLGNDVDVDGDVIKAFLATSPAHGSVTLALDGSFTYTPDANYTGPDSFTYQASDGVLFSSPALVKIEVGGVNDGPTVTVIPGGNCRDDGHGGSLNLLLADPDTPAGSLTLSGASSNTMLLPNSGISFAGIGATRTVAIQPVTNHVGTSVVTVTVSDGSLSGTTQLTVKVGGGANNKLNGNAGPDLLVGDNGVFPFGRDTLTGNGGHDVLCGNPGGDKLRGGDGEDTMFGQAGSDALTGGNGADFFSGGPGADSNTDFTPAQGDTTDGT